MKTSDGIVMPEEKTRIGVVQKTYMTILATTGVLLCLCVVFSDEIKDRFFGNSVSQEVDTAIADMSVLVESLKAESAPATYTMVPPYRQGSLSLKGRVTYLRYQIDFALELQRIRNGSSGVRRPGGEPKPIGSPRPIGDSNPVGSAKP